MREEVEKMRAVEVRHQSSVRTRVKEQEPLHQVSLKRVTMVKEKTRLSHHLIALEVVKLIGINQT